MKKLLVLLILVMSAALLFLTGCKVLGYTPAATKEKAEYAVSSADFAFTEDGQLAIDIVLKEDTDADLGEYKQITLAADGTFTFEEWEREAISEGQKLALYDADDDGTVESGAEQDAFYDAEDKNEDGEIEQGVILMGVDDNVDNSVTDADPANIRSYRGTWSYDSETNRITFTITGYYGHLIETDSNQYDEAWAWHDINWAPDENEDAWDGIQKSLTFTVFFDPIGETITRAAIGEETESTTYTTYYKEVNAEQASVDDADSSTEVTTSVTIDEDAKTIKTSVVVSDIDGDSATADAGGGDVVTSTIYYGLSQAALSTDWDVSGPALTTDGTLYTHDIVYGYDYKATDDASEGQYTYKINDVISMARYEVDTPSTGVNVMDAVTDSVVDFPELDGAAEDERLNTLNTLIDDAGARTGDFSIDELEDTGGEDILQLADAFEDGDVVDLETFLGW